MQGVVHYMIKWAGFETKHNNYEPACNILDETLINDFLKGEVARGKLMCVCM